MIEWGQKSKPKKIPGPKFNPQKIPFWTSLVVLYSRNYAARIHRNYHKSSDCFEYPKKSLLKSSYPEKFSHPKKSRNQKFQTQIYPLIFPASRGVVVVEESRPLLAWNLRSFLSLEIQSNPWGVRIKQASIKQGLTGLFLLFFCCRVRPKVYLICKYKYRKILKISPSK